MRLAATSTVRTASEIKGTNSALAGAPSRWTSSSSQDGYGRSLATTPTAGSPSTTRQPTRSSASHSSSPSAGASSRRTPRSLPRSASTPARWSTPARRRIGRAGVPSWRTIATSRPSMTTLRACASTRSRGWVTWKEPSSPCGRPMRPTLMSSPAASGSATPRALVDDVDEDAALLLHRGGLDDRPQGVGRAAALADDPAVVVLADGQLEDDRAVLLVELLHRDLVGVVDELPGQVVEQLLHRDAEVLDVGDVDALRAQELADLRGGRGAGGDPVAHAVLVDRDGRGLGLGVVLPQDLDVAAVAGRALIGGDDAPDRVLLRAHARQSESNCHGSPCVGPGKALEPARRAAAGKRRERLAGLAHHGLQVRHAALADLLHDLAHLAELLDELVDRLDVRARPLGDPQAPRALDQLGPAALLGRHREDDRLDAVELTLVHLHVLELLAAEPGDHPEDRGQRAHLADLPQLLEEVLERELVAAQLALELLGLVLVELRLGLLDERQDIAHAQDPLGHAVGVEALELVELLADRREEDRLAGDRLDRQRGAAAGVAVELGHHDAVEVHRLGELLRHVDGVLAGHRIDDEQDRVRADSAADVLELLHQALVDVEAAGRVHDQDVLALLLGAVQRPPRDVHRVAVGPLLVDVGAGLAADLDELVHGRRAVDVARRDGDRGPVLLLEMPGQLGRRGRLARALEAGHEDDRRRPRRERDPRRGAAHEGRELLVDDLDDLLAGVELTDHVGAQAALLDAARELLDDLEVDVGLEQREADLAHGLVDVVLGQGSAGADVGERLLELLGEGVEHGPASVGPSSVPPADRDGRHGGHPWRRPALAQGSRVADDGRVPVEVLVVDDNARFRVRARGWLEAGGFTVVAEAADGASALEAAYRHRPDVVLLDVGLPDMSGLTVAERLTREPDAPAV